jgi:hypothetical protein
MSRSLSVLGIVLFLVLRVSANAVADTAPVASAAPPGQTNFSSATHGESTPAVSLGFGTLGLSLDAAQPIDLHHDVRLDMSMGSASWLTFTDSTIIDVPAHFRVSESGHLATIRATSGIALGRDHVRFVGGLLWHRTAVDATVIGAQSYITVGGKQYSAAQLGALGAQLRWYGIAPYVGIASGRGGDFARRPRVEWEVGTFYEGLPQVTLQPGPFLAQNPNLFGKYLAAYAVQFQQRHKAFSFYPIVQLRYRVH